MHPWQTSNLGMCPDHFLAPDSQYPSLSLSIICHSLLKTDPFFIFCDNTPSSFPLSFLIMSSGFSFLDFFWLSFMCGIQLSMELYSFMVIVQTESRPCGFSSLLWHLLYVLLWMEYCTYLGLSFFNYKKYENNVFISYAYCEDEANLNTGAPRHMTGLCLDKPIVS